MAGGGSSTVSTSAGYSALGVLGPSSQASVAGESLAQSQARAAGSGSVVNPTIQASQKGETLEQSRARMAAQTGSAVVSPQYSAPYSPAQSNVPKQGAPYSPMVSQTPKPQKEYVTKADRSPVAKAGNEIYENIGVEEASYVSTLQNTFGFTEFTNPNSMVYQFTAGLPFGMSKLLVTGATALGVIPEKARAVISTAGTSEGARIAGESKSNLEASFLSTIKDPSTYVAAGFGAGSPRAAVYDVAGRVGVKAEAPVFSPMEYKVTLAKPASSVVSVDQAVFIGKGAEYSRVEGIPIQAGEFRGMEYASYGPQPATIRGIEIPAEAKSVQVIQPQYSIGPVKIPAGKPVTYVDNLKLTSRVEPKAYQGEIFGQGPDMLVSTVTKAEGVGGRQVNLPAESSYKLSATYPMSGGNVESIKAPSPPQSIFTNTPNEFRTIAHSMDKAQPVVSRSGIIPAQTIDYVSYESPVALKGGNTPSLINAPRASYYPVEYSKPSGIMPGDINVEGVPVVHSYEPSFTLGRGMRGYEIKAESKSTPMSKEGNFEVSRSTKNINPSGNPSYITEARNQAYSNLKMAIPNKQSEIPLSPKDDLVSITLKAEQNFNIRNAPASEFNHLTELKNIDNYIPEDRFSQDTETFRHAMQARWDILDKQVSKSSVEPLDNIPKIRWRPVREQKIISSPSQDLGYSISRTYSQAGNSGLKFTQERADLMAISKSESMVKTPSGVTSVKGVELKSPEYVPEKDLFAPDRTAKEGRTSKIYKGDAVVQNFDRPAYGEGSNKGFDASLSHQLASPLDSSAKAGPRSPYMKPFSSKSEPVPRNEILNPEDFAQVGKKSEVTMMQGYTRQYYDAAHTEASTSIANTAISAFSNTRNMHLESAKPGPVEIRFRLPSSGGGIMPSTGLPVVKPKSNAYGNTVGNAGNFKMGDAPKSYEGLLNNMGISQRNKSGIGDKPLSGNQNRMGEASWGFSEWQKPADTVGFTPWQGTTGGQRSSSMDPDIPRLPPSKPWTDSGSPRNPRIFGVPFSSSLGDGNGKRLKTRASQNVKSVLKAMFGG